MTDKERIDLLEKENRLLTERSKELEKLSKQTGSLSSQTRGLYDDQSNYIGDWSLNAAEILKKVQSDVVSIGKELNPFDLGPFQELDIKATSLQNKFGSSKGQIEDYKQSIADIIPELIRMGITEEDAVKNMGEVMKSMGSTATLGVEAITQLSAASKVSGIEVGTLATNFRDVGISVYDVGERMKEVTDIARAAGVSAVGVSEKVSKNLENLNLFNFDNGVKGLAKMAVTSERLGINMEHTFLQAEKLMNPEAAINMSAALQRLGVTSSGLLDPLRAMDMAQNDPEALQKEFINLGKEFTKMNETTGQMEILPGAKRRMREVADAVGMSASEFAKMALKAGDFDNKMKQIKFPTLATDKETKEMIAGMAQLKDGKAQINVKNEATGSFDLKSVDQLTGKDIEMLKKQQEEESMSIEDVAKEQLNISQKIEANTRGARSSVRMGKATTEPLEKLVNTMMGVQVDFSKNLSNTMTTKGTRETLSSIIQPVEQYITGGVIGNENMQKGAESNFLKALDSAEQKIKLGADTFLTTTMTDISNRFKEAYAQPQKVETKSEISVNVKVTGDENTKNMNEQQFEDMYRKLLTNPEMTSYSENQLQGGNQPSATTGGKNK